jgi:hypothetical protein
MREMINVYKILLGNPEGKRSFGDVVVNGPQN